MKHQVIKSVSLLTSIILMLTLFVSVFAAIPTFAAEADENGFTIENGVLTGYSGTAAEVVVPNTVTAIGSRAFFKQPITSITIPSSVKRIDTEAFLFCGSLKKVTFKNPSITKIAEYAFSSCANLTSIDLPDTITTLGEGIFHNCVRLQSAELPSGLSVIPDRIFYSCKQLTTVNYPKNITAIGEGAFYQCERITNNAIPSTVTSIGDSAFRYCDGITSIDLSENVGYEAIGKFTFANMEGLTSILLPAGITSIANYSFYGDKLLNEITLDKTIETIGKSVFGSTNENFTVKCYSNSTALTYAIDNSLKYEILDADVETDTDTETDVDTETEIDTDTVVDTDVDTDTVVDTEIDTDTIVDTEIDTDTVVDTEVDTDTVVDTEIDTDTVVDTEVDTDTVVDTEIDTDTVVETETDTEIVLNGWVEDSYYVDNVKLTGIALADGYYYDFGEDGVCTGQVKYTGIYYDVENSVYRYIENGAISSGWKLIDGEWYYFRSSTKAACTGYYNFNYLFDGKEVVYFFEETGKVSSGIWYPTEEGTMYFYGPSNFKNGWTNINGKDFYFENGYRYEGYRYIPESGVNVWYDFGDNGALVSKLDNYSGLVINKQGTYYVENGVSQYGLRLIGGYYYYFQRSDSSAVKDCEYYVTNTNGLKNYGTYAFDAEGKMILNNEIVAENGGLYYYEDGVIVGKGLVEIDGTYYYVRSSGQLATGKYYVTRTNGFDIAVDWYEFDETTGAMIMPKDGIVAENGGLYYYENGVLVGKGLVEIDGKYYYVRSNAQVATGRYYVTRTNGFDIAVDWYNFDEQTGAMVMPKNGVVTENGILYYYENDVLVGKGLVEIDGSYYYVRSNGQLATGRYYVTRTNGYDFAEGWYYFDTFSGAMR